MKENIKVHGQLKGYLSWPLLLSVFMVCANIAAGCVSRIGGLVMIPFTISYLGVAMWIFFYSKKRILGGLVDFSAEYAWIQKQLLTGLALPYALADEDGRIVWANDEFQAITALEKGNWKNLLTMFPEVTKDDLATDEDPVKVHTVFGERRFRMELQPIYVSSSEQEEIQAVISRQKLLAVYLFDETEILRCRQQITDEKMVAGIIYLDNYDEALESVEEVRRSLLTALIDRKINKYIGAVDGILKSIEKDKYFFAVKQKYMKKIMQTVDKNAKICIYPK